ncbi:outer membrane beta-barrel protein [Maribacter sp. 2307ULW6-5]|uniref:outer membrane beta-barrel protein n=1 Tax=Maribacter sp. 2307ULW6-5 TaxID=3386275 RepID=UPI0039BD15AC
MKKTILMAFALLACGFALAQTGSGFGIKAGINYAGNGDFFDSAQDAFRAPDRNVGYHVGVFGKLGNRLYIRPELVYTSTTSGYDEGDLKINKLDLPVLFGAKIIGPLNIFVGPSFQYLLNTEFADVDIDEVENDVTVGLNLGAGVNLGKFGVDVRYERGFSENEITFLNNNLPSINTNDRVDTRPDQVILSLSYKF